MSKNKITCVKYVTCFLKWQWNSIHKNSTKVISNYSFMVPLKRKKIYTTIDDLIVNEEHMWCT